MRVLPRTPLPVEAKFVVLDYEASEHLYFVGAPILHHAEDVTIKFVICAGRRYYQVRSTS